MGNNPLEIATYSFEFTSEFREILNNQCRIISANIVREFTFDDWHVNWPLNICSSHFCPAFLAMKLPDDWRMALDQKKDVGVVVIDLSKALTLSATIFYLQS